MPYKDPERKRQWEQEHREQRNAARRMQRLDARSGQNTAPKQATNPVSYQKPKSSWKTIVGFAVGLGVVLLAAFPAVNVPPYGDLGPSLPGSGNSAV